MYIYLNGRITHEKEAVISPFDHGYMYGLGLFETFRVDDGHPFLLDDHFHRLVEGARALGIKWSYSRKEVVATIRELLRVNGLKSAYVRWNVSAGPAALGLQTEDYTEPTVIVYMKPLPQKQAEAKDAVILAVRRNTPEGSDRLKSHHFLNNVLAKREVGHLEHTEGIFLTDDGCVAEGIVSNIFWVKNETVYTPTTSTGILNGITRQFIIALLHKKGVKVEVGYYSKVELLNADAAFITNSIQEVVALAKCEETHYTIEHEIIHYLHHSFGKYRNRLWSRDEIVEAST